MLLRQSNGIPNNKNGLGTRFVSAVKETAANIIKMPSAYAVKYKNVRIAHVKTFPYNIHFFIDEATQQIVIISIIHNKRSDALSPKR